MLMICRCNVYYVHPLDQYLLISTEQQVQLKLMRITLALWMFVHELYYWTNWNVKVRGCQGIYGNRYFTQNYQCETHSGIKGKVRGWSDLVEFILRGPWISVLYFRARRTIAVEIFQSQPNWYCHDYPTIPSGTMLLGSGQSQTPSN